MGIFSKIKSFFKKNKTQLAEDKTEKINNDIAKNTHSYTSQTIRVPLYKDKKDLPKQGYNPLYEEKIPVYPQAYDQNHPNSPSSATICKTPPNYGKEKSFKKVPHISRVTGISKKSKTAKFKASKTQKIEAKNQSITATAETNQRSF